jgi:hypothetical protein
VYQKFSFRKIGDFKDTRHNKNSSWGVQVA